MHELGVLYQALKTVEKVAEKNNIARIKHLSLELGQESDCLGEFLEKLFPVAAAEFPFAPFLVIGFAVSLLFGKEIIEWYLSLLGISI